MSLALTLDDLPAGFEEIPAAEFGLEKGAELGDDLVIDESFGFINTEDFTFILGFTVLIPSALERAGFDIALGDPDFLLDSLIGGMGSDPDSVTRDELSDVDDIGNSAAGVTVGTDIEGLPFRVDVIVFRRDVAGAFTVVMHLEGQDPALSVHDVARLLDARMAAQEE